MRKRFIFGMGGAAVLAAAGMGAAEEPVEVSVAGLRVVGDGYGEGAVRISPLNWRKGTTVALLVESAEGTVLRVDPGECALEVFEDDKGTDLRPAGGSARPVFGLFPERSADGRAVLLEIWGDAVAAEGARELRVKGELACAVGGEKRLGKTEKITPRTGAAGVLGGRTVSVISGLPFPDEVGEEEEKEGEGEEKKEKKAEKDEAGNEAEEGVVSVRIDGEPEGVGKVRILDGKGEPVEVEELGVRVIRRGGVRAIHRFGFPEGFGGEIMIEAEVWEGGEMVRVPFEEKFSVGLDGRAGG